jgi:phenylalanyl-tRNA synthetase beta chain
MDIKILDSWLRDYLQTTATPEKIAEYISLCGPSVEKIEKIGNDYLYNIEITTNRVDTASVYGIAREASAILPRFGVKAKLKRIKSEPTEYIFVKEVPYLKATVDTKLCYRFSAVLIKNVKIGNSPNWVKERLKSAGVRSLNNIIDISNYIMLELGQPVHTFDYDKIKDAKMILRESKKGETIQTLDGKIFTLPGGDIVIEDGGGRLIDLAGIMGGSLSAIDENTKNVLLFVQTYNPIYIRKTSMSLAQRTMAATIFEKGTDTELVSPAILKAIDLFKKNCSGIPERNILNIYPNPYKTKVVKTDLEFIEKRLGVAITKKEITNYLTALEFEPQWGGNQLIVSVPSFRSKDVNIEEDILEEIARIYGYHNLPSKLMDGEIPDRPINPIFGFENNIKTLLSGWGGVEIYTLSLVPKDFVGSKALKLKNPLGADSEYLRTSLMPSLISAANENTKIFQSFHLFEIANIYLPKMNDLPDEKVTLAGIFAGYKYREAKGIIEALFEKLHIAVQFSPDDIKGFSAGHSLSINIKDKKIGSLGVVDTSDFIYYELDVSKLWQAYPETTSYKGIPKYPPQIEDLTIILPEKTKVGDVIETVMSTNSLIGGFELTDIYENAYTFRVKYQDPKKTLTDTEVEEIRTKILQRIKEKFGGMIKT